MASNQHSDWRRCRTDILSSATRAAADIGLRLSRSMSAVMSESRKARVAEELHRRLRSMSDADLAKAGTARHRIATHIRERLYDNPAW